MSITIKGIIASAVAILLVFASNRWPTHAQESPSSANPPVSVQDALLRPLSLPFVKETRLEEVAAYLRKALRAPVVLDLAALRRRELTPESTVRLELQGVRLKTGLQLLLDQVELTYRVVAEDNLLILTDDAGAEDPIRQVVAEVKSLHHEVHDLRDLVNDLLDSMSPQEEPGPSMRKPTIIEEIPDEKGKPKGEEKSSRSRPGY